MLDSNVFVIAGCGGKHVTGLWDSRVDFMPLMCGHDSGCTTPTTLVSYPWFSLELPSITRYCYCMIIM